MSIKIADLAKKLGVTAKELKQKAIDLGAEITMSSRVLDEDTAELIEAELSSSNDDLSEDGETDTEMSDTADEYADLLDKQFDREIIKTQRKKTAGRESGKKRDAYNSQSQKSSDALEIGDTISVKEYAEKASISAARVIGELMKNGILANINQKIDFETIQIISEELGVKVGRKRSEASAEDLMQRNLDAIVKEDDKNNLEDRPPVISIMGHVDHGKTSLLDYIRNSNVVASESGGITQHIAAYQVEKNGNKITFLDTPGHEAFTAMRARGAKATDIAILVVASNEGVKPQTIEAINHAKDAGIPIMVAITKVDLQDANIDRVKGELVEHGLQPEDWGGDTIMIPVSAVSGEGMDNLLEMILLVAEVADLKANPNREAVATVIESHMDKSLGPVATVLINTGTLHVMDNFVIGATHGRIKAMFDHRGKRIKEAEPSKPVLIAGLEEIPIAGDLLQVVSDEKTARNQAESVKALQTLKGNDGDGANSREILAGIHSGNINALKIILKSDTKGSLEAIRSSLLKINSDLVSLKIVHAEASPVTESDIMMAAAGGALVFAFHAMTNPQVEKLAAQYGVEIRKYSVIYKLLEDVKAIMTGMLDPETIEIVLGQAKIKAVFFTKRSEKIIGCGIESGKIENKTHARVIRAGEVIGEGRIDSLKKVDKVVSELASGNDCGIKFIGGVDLEEGDILESFKFETRARQLESS